mmetsp:Transcript_3812/g.24115  ORF Transcript_3812/g.24115 Transcript_3812/m.24115 type:complete len:106 (+) Transcript_3812:2688-3005(+)
MQSRKLYPTIPSLLDWITIQDNHRRAPSRICLPNVRRADFQVLRKSRGLHQNRWRCPCFNFTPSLCSCQSRFPKRFCCTQVRTLPENNITKLLEWLKAPLFPASR